MCPAIQESIDGSSPLRKGLISEWLFIVVHVVYYRKQLRIRTVSSRGIAQRIAEEIFEMLCSQKRRLK